MSARPKGLADIEVRYESIWRSYSVSEKDIGVQVPQLVPTAATTDAVVVVAVIV